MAKTPAEWQRWVYSNCVYIGLYDCDAEECVSETLLRYHARRGAYPWDEPVPDEQLLRLLARNVAHEYKRAHARRQQLEREYCALQQALIASATDPEQQAIANADAAQFRASLPRYLKQTLTLLEAGYTPAETAQRLGVCASTVYTYIRDLKAHFVEFFGYDPRIRGGCVVNYSGSAHTGSQTNLEEVADDETAEGFGRYGVGVGDSELGGDAPHLGGAERVQRGGAANPVMSSGGCGCSAKPVLLSEADVRRHLNENARSLARILPLAQIRPAGDFPVLPSPNPAPPITIVPSSGCEGCNHKATVDANSYCKNPPDADCNGIWPWNNDYIYIWRIRVYHCPESRYECEGPFRTDQCCRTQNTADEPCRPPAHDPTVPNRPMTPCAERVVVGN